MYVNSVFNRRWMFVNGFLFWGTPCRLQEIEFVFKSEIQTFEIAKSKYWHIYSYI